jgi:hypothetical protein
MQFEAERYGVSVAEILALDGDGARLMPLAYPSCSSAPARDRIAVSTARKLFPQARAPEAAYAGLYLYFSCWDEAHQMAQSVNTAEGSYWHAIAHRQEPDAGNSSYWFRRVGRHAIFPALLEEAVAVAGPRFGQNWDPFAFIDYCEQARREPGSELERKAREIQRAEWQLLFHYCAAPL